ncbi:HK97 family prohead peptidase protein [Rhizobium gallicum]|uniref:HK97 family prohead peptidase protein n=2 Tax=Rhizobium gallicum TaxID=56730 RepID=A0A1L5NML1_9HYPH|nr:HK97 family prohead peptidase protein [Rhizobium gallicum]
MPLRDRQRDSFSLLTRDLGKRIHALMSASVLDGLSIGFRPKRTRTGSGGVSRYLLEVDLRELSIVDEPSNDPARIASLSPSDAAFGRLRDALQNVKSSSLQTHDAAFEKLKAVMLDLA